MSIVSPPQRLAGFQEEVRLEVLRRLHRTPYMSQRVLARELGISLGSINFCFQALVEKGWVKMHNFNQSKSKMRYTYLLTPAGVAEKSKLTGKFLKLKLAEYEALQAEIEALKAEIAVNERAMHCPSDGLSTEG